MVLDVDLHVTQFSHGSKKFVHGYVLRTADVGSTSQVKLREQKDVVLDIVDAQNPGTSPVGIEVRVALQLNCTWFGWAHARESEFGVSIPRQGRGPPMRRLSRKPTQCCRPDRFVYLASTFNQSYRVNDGLLPNCP
jgi:hypothetical protein